MGIIEVGLDALRGELADQWLEAYEAENMGDNTVFTAGVPVHLDDRRGHNRKGTGNLVSNGSLIHVYPNQFMMLVDGGQIVDYTAQEGYYKVENSSSPSLFSGGLKESVRDSFQRFQFGGATPKEQRVFFINLQEIKGIKFGTRNPINYFDNFYNAELFLRAHGTYSIKITDPILFYREAVPRNSSHVEIGDINEQYLYEFLEALQASINQMSMDGVRVSHVASKGRELSKYMATTLDEEWRQTRGMEVQAVGIASISYDEESTKLINMRNQGAMLSDAAVREGYVQGAMARGMEAAGSNANGSMAGFMGMGMAMQTGGGFMGAASQSNQQQMSREANVPAGETWSCACGKQNAGKFCDNCGKPRPQPAGGGWNCVCGKQNSGKFCTECGSPRPAAKKIRCNKCGYEPDGNGTVPKFCPECGDIIDQNDVTQ